MPGIVCHTGDGMLKRGNLAFNFLFNSFDPFSQCFPFGQVLF
jgi:hypothetical protein